MTVADLVRLFDYGYWANRRLFGAIAQLAPDQFTQEIGGSYGSIRNTLVHMMSAEWGWLDRCGGPARGPALKSVDYPTLASVTETWTRLEAEMRAFLAARTEGDVDRPITFTLGQQGTQVMPLGELLQHAANHAVHHRGQVALLVRMLGYAPGNVDMVIYDGERPRPATG
jgi:uncharacterized damage-inducible protein DinB